MALIYPDIVRALFSLTGPGVLTGKGATSTTHHGAGDNTITLEQPLDSTKCVMVPGVVGSPAANVTWVGSYTNTTDANKRIVQSVASLAASTVVASDTPVLNWAVFALPGA